MENEQHRIYPKYDIPYNPRWYGGHHLFVYITPIRENLPDSLEEWRDQISSAINSCMYEPHVLQGPTRPWAGDLNDKAFGCVRTWTDDGFTKVRNYSPTHTKVIEYWFHHDPEDAPKLDYVRKYWKWYQTNAGNRNVPNEYPVRVKQDMWLNHAEGEPDPRANPSPEDIRKKKKIM